MHHVNLGIPEDGLEAEADWLVNVLGYRHLDAGPDSPTANWFEGEDGRQIHLSIDPEHRAPKRAHVAVVFDDLSDVQHQLAQRGVDFQMGPARNGLEVLNCADPAGNRWELRHPVTAG
jgi:catechol 2,3-dioxygenase-like lactoylglutathione lyase family enzyme